MDVPRVAIHSDTLNEGGFMKRQQKAIAGREIHIRVPYRRRRWWSCPDVISR